MAVSLIHGLSSLIMKLDEAFEDCHVDYTFYVHRERPLDEILRGILSMLV